MLDHNFLMKNVISLKNNEFVFLINEYIRGKTLSKLLKDSGPFTKQQAQFYIASLIIVIQYLHSNHFIHRDIKPENVMVNSNGYIKLIDFGTVKETSSKNGTALTIIGTPHYMAPEVMKGIAYNCSVDYWSVGVCLYEFIFGKVPFAPEHKDPNEIYKAINNYIDCKTNIRFPSGYKDVELVNLLNGMLARDCNKRIKYNELMKHKWFEGFNWKELVEMNLNVPYKPGGSDLDDLNCKGSNYMTALKTLVFNNSNSNSSKHKELTKWDYEKGEKWLKEF
jgi:cGMP-dependent protein kinase